MITEGRFAGQVLFATGAGSGIAAAVAERFTAEGGRVAVLDILGDRAAETAGRLTGAIPLVGDVADEAAVSSAVAETVRQFGTIDCVLNAAGHVKFGRLEEYAYEDWQRMMSVHAGGTFLVCKHTIPVLRRAGRGSIVNIASTAALEAQTGNFAYGAAKGAIVAFSRQIALDVRPGVRVNTVAPGRTRTAMTEPLYVARGHGDYDEGVRDVLERIMAQRIAEAPEIASLITFLLSDEAGFLTAGLYVADGGETSW